MFWETRESSRSLRSLEYTLVSLNISSLYRPVLNRSRPIKWINWQSLDQILYIEPYYPNDRVKLDIGLQAEQNQIQKQKKKNWKNETNLKLGHKSIEFPGFQDGEHRLTDVERVTPVVVFDRPIILLDAQNPTTQDLQIKRHRHLF
jgi:hypothetical protein